MNEDGGSASESVRTLGSSIPGNVSDGCAVVLEAGFDEGIGDFLVELLQYCREWPADSRTRNRSILTLVDSIVELGVTAIPLPTTDCSSAQLFQFQGTRRRHSQQHNTTFFFFDSTQLGLL